MKKAILFSVISVLVLNSYGQVGIGTTSPTEKLEIKENKNGQTVLNVINQHTGTGAHSGLWIGNNQTTNRGGIVVFGSNYTSTTRYLPDHTYLYNGGAGVSIFAENSTGILRLGTYDQERIRVSATGNVGIGTSSPDKRLEIVGDGTVSNAMLVTSNHSTNQGSSGKYGFYTVKHYTNAEEPLGLIAAESNSGASYVKIGGGFSEVNAATSVSFFTGSTTTITSGDERMTITSSGRVGIGTSSPSYQLDVQGGDINASGSVRAATVALTSDMRLKNISETISSNDNINTIRYEWKDGRDSRMHIGYGAQDVEKILPDAVYTDAEGLKAVNYDEVHTYKLQLQEERIRELERRLDEMSKLLKRKRRLK
jgi:Chaperone of endosialidase